MHKGSVASPRHLRKRAEELMRIRWSPRVRRACILVGLTCGLYVFSVFYKMGYWGNGVGLSIVDGAAYAIWAPEFFVERINYGVFYDGVLVDAPFLPSFHFDQVGWTLGVPIWCLAVPFLAWSLFRHPVDSHPCCSQCGYRLYGLTSNRCPECGTAFQSGQEKRKI